MSTAFTDILLDWVEQNLKYNKKNEQLEIAFT